MAAFVHLVEKNMVGVVTLRMTEVVEASFEAHPMRGGSIPRSEVKRRFDLCANIFEKLRGDLKWGLERVWGHLPAYLGDELNGVQWLPDARTIWSPGDGA